MTKSTSAMICVGIGPMDGCGSGLTLLERRLFGEMCEHCALDWDERVRAWRFGRIDPDLDLHFGGDMPFGSEVYLDDEMQPEDDDLPVEDEDNPAPLRSARKAAA